MSKWVLSERRAEELQDEQQGSDEGKEGGVVGKGTLAQMKSILYKSTRYHIQILMKTSYGERSGQ